MNIRIIVKRECIMNYVGVTVEEWIFPFLFQCIVVLKDFCDGTIHLLMFSNEIKNVSWKNLKTRVLPFYRLYDVKSRPVMEKNYACCPIWISETVFDAFILIKLHTTTYTILVNDIVSVCTCKNNAYFMSFLYIEWVLSTDLFNWLTLHHTQLTFV